MSQGDGERGRVATRAVERTRVPVVRVAAEPVPEHDRLGASAAFAVIAVLAVLVAAAWWWTHHEASGRIDHGTTVAGVAIGGQQPSAAVETLRQRLGERATADIPLDVAGRTVRVDPATAGLSVDYRATVERAATGDSWQPSALWRFYTDGGAVAPVVDVDETRLRAELARLVQQLGVAPRNATLSFRGGLVRVVHAHEGQGLDVDHVSAALRAAYLTDTPAHVELTAVPPPVSDRTVQAALDHFVNPAVASPVTLTLAGHRVVLTPHRFVPALRLVADGSQLRLDADPRRLMQLIDPVTRRLGQPRDATVVIDHGQPRIVPGRPGVRFSAQQVRATFVGLLYRRPPHRVGSVPAQEVQPKVTPADVRQLFVDTPVASASGPVGSAPAPVVARQVAALDGTLLRPGQTLSLARIVPPSTSGDLTGLATALYAASYRAGLAEVEHRAPATHDPRAPLGLEAIVEPGGPDLRFRDDTPYGVLVSAHVSGGAVQVTLWSTPQWTVSSSASCTPVGSGISEVTLTRRLSDVAGGGVSGQQVFRTDYQGLPRAVCRAAR